MKTTFLFIFLLLSSLSLSHAKPLDIRSWATYDKQKIDQLNSKIIKASKNEEEWVIDPTRYVFKLFGFSGIEEYSIEYSFDSGIKPDYLTVGVYIENIKDDDSTLGLIYYVDMKKNGNSKNGTWRIEKVKQTYRCRRSENKDIYTAKLCP